MGLLTKLAGEAVKKIASEATKKIVEESDRHVIMKQVESLLEYSLNNFKHFQNVIVTLEEKTKTMIANFLELEGRKKSFDEKRTAKKLKEEIEDNLEYLYLSKEYFSFLFKVSNSVSLMDKEYWFIIKYAPFFDGKKVLKMQTEEKDHSFLGELKHAGKELLGDFLPPTLEFDLYDFLKNYRDEIDKMVLPDIYLELKKFESIIPSQEMIKSDASTLSASKNKSCSNCNQTIDANVKFCPYCGNKVEMIKFCANCGKQLSWESKFCPECGHKNEQ